MHPGFRTYQCIFAADGLQAVGVDTGEFGAKFDSRRCRPSHNTYESGLQDCRWIWRGVAARRSRPHIRLGLISRPSLACKFTLHRCLWCEALLRSNGRRRGRPTATISECLAGAPDLLHEHHSGQGHHPGHVHHAHCHQHQHQAPAAADAITAVVGADPDIPQRPGVVPEVRRNPSGERQCRRHRAFSGVPLGAVLAETAVACTGSWDPDFLDLDRAVLAQRQRAGLGHPAGLDRIQDRAR